MDATRTGRRAVILLVILLLLVGGSSGGGDFRRWIPNTNFETAANWERGKVPCANDHVRFPMTMGTVFVQTNTTITELILPLNGELVLGNYVSLSFPLQSSYTAGCPTDREVKYTRTDAKSWFDPDDWCMTAVEGGDCKAEQPALLVTEQVPCRVDTVSFPMSSSFRVGLGFGTDIYAGSLIIGGKHYTTSSFKALIDSEKGRRTWVRGDGSPATTITLTNKQCTDKSGCACGNDKGSIVGKICATPRGKCATTLACTHPVKVLGGCCEICGAVMKLDIGSNFNKKDTSNMILSKCVHGDDKYKDVKPVVSKTSFGQIQIVLTDPGDGELSAEVASSLKKEFEGNSKYDVSGIKIDASKNVVPTSAAQIGLETGTTIGIVLAVLIIVAIVGLLVYFIFWQSRRPTIPINLNFEDIKSTFRNFGWPRSPSDMELGTVSFTNTPGADDLSYGFDNPMYGDTSTAQAMAASNVKMKHPTPAATMITPTKLEPADSGTRFSNPIYGSPALTLDFENVGVEIAPGAKSGSKSAATKLTFPDASAGGFSNPVFGEDYAAPIQVVDAVGATAHRAGPIDSSDSAVLVLNPVFSSDGVDEDSFI